MVKTWLTRVLTELLVWVIHVLTELLARVAPSLPNAVDDRVDPLDSLALLVVQQVSTAPHTGSFKRVVASRALRQRFPDRRARDLNLAIEFAVRKVIP